MKIQGLGQCDFASHRDCFNLELLRFLCAFFMLFVSQEKCVFTNLVIKLNEHPVKCSTCS